MTLTSSVSTRKLKAPTVLRSPMLAII